MTEKISTVQTQQKPDPGAELHCRWYEKTHIQLCFKGEGEGLSSSSRAVRVHTSYMNFCSEHPGEGAGSSPGPGLLLGYSWEQQGPLSPQPQKLSFLFLPLGWAQVTACSPVGMLSRDCFTLRKPR